MTCENVRTMNARETERGVLDALEIDNIVLLGKLCLQSQSLALS